MTPETFKISIIVIPHQNDNDDGQFSLYKLINNANSQTVELTHRLGANLRPIMELKYEKQMRLFF